MPVEAPDIPIVGFDDFDAFRRELQKRSAIRLVRVDDRGLVEPARRNGVSVMQPMVRVVATAFDPETRQILRWLQQWDVGDGKVTVHLTSPNGGHRDFSAAQLKQEVSNALQLLGFQVVSGEWTLQSVQSILAGPFSGT